MLTGIVCACACVLHGADLRDTTVFLSPGHGLYRHPDFGWTYQRDPHHGVLEDIDNADTVFAFLTEYLRRAGADVWPTRCECPSEVEVIVPAGAAACSGLGAWQTPAPDRSVQRAAHAPLSGTHYRPLIPASGRYPLYVRYPSGPARSADARVRVAAGGGIHEVRVDQRRHAGTWRYVGTYYFFAGYGQTIEVASGEDGGFYAVDAIRIGGGIGDRPSAHGGPPSGRARYRECSVYWTGYQGATARVFNARSGHDARSDVAARPLFAEALHTPDTPALFIAYHTNAGGGSGTETYSFDGDAPPGSDLLRDLLQREIIAGLRGAWDPAWRDRGVKRARLGELMPLRRIPGALIEAAFHDNPADIPALRSARWRRTVCRAVYHAVARYRHGDGAILAPEPPEGLSAHAAGAHAITLTWRAPPAGPRAGGAGPAAHYRLHMSTSGLAFKTIGETDGHAVQVADLAPGMPLFFRVTAVNAGGESFPSRTAGIVLPEDPGAPRALLVHAYPDDHGVVPLRDRCGGKEFVRLLPGRTPGGGDLALEHVFALWSAAPGIGIDFTQSDVLALSEPDRLDLIVVACGNQRSGALSPSAAAALLAHVNRGGRLIVSGAHPAHLLQQSGAAALLARLGVRGRTPVRSRAPITVGQHNGLPVELALGASTDWGLAAGAEGEILHPAHETRPFAYTSDGAVGIVAPRAGALIAFPIEHLRFADWRAAVYARALEALAPLGGGTPPAAGTFPAGHLLTTRRLFTAAAPETLDSLVLEIRHRGGFTAFLNGRQVAHRRAASGGYAVEEIEIVGAARGCLSKGSNRFDVEFAQQDPRHSAWALRASRAGLGHFYLCVPAGAAAAAPSTDALALGTAACITVPCSARTPRTQPDADCAR